MMGRLTYERLRELLHYDPETGIFTRRVSRGSRWPAGTVVGSNSNGYVSIWLDGMHHKAHRLAWLYMTGGWPDGDIDHIDRSRKNNAWANLRDVSRSINTHNSGLYRHNTSGVKGVHLCSFTGRWRAEIRKHGTVHNLGRHKDKADAVAARRAAEKELFIPTAAEE